MAGCKTYQVAFIETPIHPYCKIINVLDVASGEVLLSKTAGDVQAAFANGYNACGTEVIISREVVGQGGEYREVRSAGEDAVLYCKGWMGKGAKGKKRVGGKKSYLKTYLDRVLSLPENLVLPLLKLGPYATVEGRLVDPSRRRALGPQDFAKIWGVKHSRCYDYIQALKEQNVLAQQEGAYYLNRDYIGRG